MRIIYKNEPLMFVHGPPIFIRVATTDEEESTSVFVLNEEDTEEFIDTEVDQERVRNSARTNSEVFNKITSLGLPFQRQVYKPLQFVFENEVLKGAINRVEGDTLFIELVDEEDLIVAVEINTIKDVLWRGKSFQEK